MRRGVFALLCVFIPASVLLGQAVTQGIQQLQLGCVKPSYIIADDFNRDGYPDLAIACHSCDSVVVVSNLGKKGARCAALDGAVVWRLNDSPVALASGYFIDTPPGRTFPYTTVFPNIVVVTQYLPGAGRFSPVDPQDTIFLAFVNGSLNLNPLPFATLTHVVLADFDNDGQLDVAVLDGLTPQIGIYLGTRNPIAPPIPPNGAIPGNTPPAVSIALPGVSRAYFLAAADFDRDGLVDLAVAADGRVLFHQNTGNAFTGPVAQVVVGTKVTGLAVADFNRDGYIDVAAVDPEFGALAIILNRGCWVFELYQRLKKDGEPTFVVPIDCDRNGLIDLAVAEPATNTVEIVLNKLECKEDAKRGDGQDICQYTVPPQNDQPEQIDKILFFRSHSFRLPGRPVGLAVADFDRTGTSDIAVAIGNAEGSPQPGTVPEAVVIYNPCCCPYQCAEPECCPGAEEEKGKCPEEVAGGGEKKE